MKDFLWHFDIRCFFFLFDLCAIKRQIEEDMTLLLGTCSHKIIAVLSAEAIIINRQNCMSNNRHRIGVTRIMKAVPDPNASESLLQLPEQPL